MSEEYLVEFENGLKVKCKSFEPPQINNFDELLGDIASYDGYSEILLKVADDIESKYDESEFYSILDASNSIGFTIKWDTELIVFWEILVLMFGDYGTSPRSGWIENKKGCVEFIRKIFNDKSYDN